MDYSVNIIRTNTTVISEKNNEYTRDNQIIQELSVQTKRKLRWVLLKENLKKYLELFLETSSIHGLNHLVASRRQFLEIFLWLTIICLSAYGSLHLSGLTWSRYQSSPMVISMDRDMFAWNTTFPCATICPDGIEFIDRKKLNLYLRNSGEKNKTALENFIMGIANASYKSFKYVPKYTRISPEKYVELILNLSQEFKPTLTIGMEHAVLSVTPTVTEMGLCYAINSNAAEYNSPKYRAANRWDIIKSGKSSLMIHPLDGEVFAQVVDMTNAYTVYLHGPQEIPDITSKSLYSPQYHYLKLYVTALSIYTSSAASKLSVHQRRCRFPHENNLAHNSIYTYTMCRMECRIRLCLKYCGCIPHFYRKIGDERICDVNDFGCLSKHEDELYTLKNKGGQRVDCGCFPLCDDVYYVLQSNTLHEWHMGTNLQWGMATYPRMRYRREVIFGFTDVLVSVGGMAGLFLGCSVLSFIEIAYFLTLRILCYKYKRTH